jgi:hypothetical protein
MSMEQPECPERKAGAYVERTNAPSRAPAFCESVWFVT